jgi:hypothetical protein
MWGSTSMREATTKKLWCYLRDDYGPYHSPMWVPECWTPWARDPRVPREGWVRAPSLDTEITDAG